MILRTVRNSDGWSRMSGVCGRSSSHKGWVGVILQGLVTREYFAFILRWELTEEFQAGGNNLTYGL